VEPGGSPGAVFAGVVRTNAMDPARRPCPPLS